MTNTRCFNFTKASIESLESASKMQSYYDLKEKGLMIMVLPSGVKTFYLYRKINGKPERIKIGRFPDLSVENARREVHKLKGEIAIGKNPQEIKRNAQQEFTFKQLFIDFMEKYSKKEKKTWREDERVINFFCKQLFNKRASTITKQDIQKLHAKVGEENGRRQANILVQILSSIFNKSIERGWSGVNPAFGITKFKEKARERFLQPDEIGRLMIALNTTENYTTRDYIYISLLTGARKSNVLTMRWKDVSFENKTWHIKETKNGDSQIIPLTDYACEILQNRKQEAFNEFVFGSKLNSKGHIVEIKRSWSTILRKAQIEDFRLHDLRRTFGSLLASTGANSFVIGKSLNHKSQSSTAIYARLNLDPIRDAINKATNVFER